MKEPSLPKIAIVGRPNVGKSSLFNRIVGSRTAIVESSSGTTRDRLYAGIRWKGKRFTLIDTAGFEESGRGDMAELMLRQVRKGIEDADIILFVTDAGDGITADDRGLAAMLRKTSKKICLLVNKVDTDADAGKALEFFELGLGEPHAVSAMHNRGIEKVCNDLVKDIAKPAVAAAAAVPAATGGVKVAIIGRPNVGKSSFLNAILREERVIVHPVAGTTRDAIDTDFTYKGREYILIDTAGMRHNMKLKAPADFYGSVRSKEAVKRCDAAIVLIDAFEGLTKDDARIIELVIKEGKALVVAVNKWDLLKGVETAKYRESLVMEMRAIRDYPVIFMSCKTSRNIDPALDAAWAAYGRSRAVIPPDRLAETVAALNASPEIMARRIRFGRFEQEGTLPPRFAINVRSSAPLSEPLKRYVENFVRRSYDLEGAPVTIRFKGAA